jgi:ribosome maturation factor RimP
MDPAAAVHDLVIPLLSAAGLDLYDVEVGPGVVRVLIDRPGGVDLDAITAATTAISGALDAADLIGGRYNLEVSSPGLERPLRRPDHFRHFIGSTIAVKTHPGVEGDRRIEGELVTADDQGISLRTDAGDIRQLGYADIQRARSVFSWGPRPKPTAAPPRTKRPARSRGQATASS